MRPWPSVTSTATHTYQSCRSASSSVESSREKMMSVPPMVGVPAFTEWAAGPSERIDWPICRRMSRRMSVGPRRSDRLSAVRPARRVRNVMYRKTFSGAKLVCSG